MKALQATLLGSLILSIVLLGSCKKDKHRPVNFELNTSESKATWKGYLKTGYFNEGTIAVSSQELKAVNGKIVSGSFVLPLNTLENSNLPTEELKEQLIHHLQSVDFFNMLLHPQLTFVITTVTPYVSGKAEVATDANYVVTGTLTMVGKSVVISFPAKITITEHRIAVAASIQVDRTKWGINYNTDPELPDDERILDLMDIELQLNGEEK